MTDLGSSLRNPQCIFDSHQYSVRYEVVASIIGDGGLVGGGGGAVGMIEMEMHGLSMAVDNCV